MSGRRIFLAGLLSLVLPAVSRAQSPLLRATDTRTATPQAVMAERKLWGLDLGLGGNFTRGNTDVDYLGGNFSVFRKREPSSAYLSGSAIYNTSRGVRLINQGKLTARYDHSLQEPWKMFAFHTQSYNEFTRTNHRTTSGAGPWYDWALGPTAHGLSLAVTHEYERFKGGDIERAGRLSFRDVSRVPLSQVAELGADLFYVPKIDEVADYRLYAELSLQTMVWRDKLGLKVSWIDEYDSRPKPGIKPNDTLWLTSLTLRFGA
jgi:hypothetical protein